MLLTYRKAEKATVVLNDLIKINNDRILCYQQAMDQSTNLDNDLKRLFKEIISEGQKFKQELKDKIKELDGNPKDGLTLSGMVHRAWLDLKVTFTGSTRNAMISFCEYNEEITQHTYKAALNVSAEMNKEVYALIENQISALTHTYECINKCHEAHHFMDPGLIYFN